ncbi:MAG: prolyl oligopeptidase family serine peptidase [Ekhidna sp.]|nr:prolyl oligopeptidase family serine peptidase [Ekhidna sp.]
MKRRYPLFFLISLACLASCSEQPEPGKQVLITEGFSNRVLDAYWLYLPRDYSMEKKWPIIMFLQGGDASASPNPNTVQNGGPVYHFLNQQKNLPDSFLIVNPHMRTGSREQRQWFNNADGLAQIIDQTIKQYNADPNRVYLTGESRGGHGTWGVAKRHPNKFAAIVPIAGAISCKSNCDQITDLPIWIIHNHEDPVVDYEYPQTAVSYFQNQLNRSFMETDRLDAQGIQKSASVFTTFKSDQHGGAGGKVYSSHGFYSWLLTKRRN